MLAPNQIPVVMPINLGALYYNGSVNTLRGSTAGMLAALGCVAPTGAVTITSENAGLEGWNLTVGAGGIVASVTDSGGIKSATLAPGGFDLGGWPGHWVYAVLRVPADHSQVELWINGSLRAATAMVSAMIPSTGKVPQLVATADTGAFCFGYLGAADVRINPCFPEFAKLVHGNGAMGPDDAGIFDNFWSTKFYDDGSHPPVSAVQAAADIWTPQKGSINLTIDPQSPGLVTTYTLPWY